MSSLNYPNNPDKGKLLGIILVLVFISLISISKCKSQDCKSLKIDTNLISRQIDQIESGSCGSPDGPMLSVNSPPPSYNWLNTNGYCYTITPTKNFTMCFTFTATGTNIDLNAGYSSTGCATISFSGFNLYTCNPSCTFVGTGLSFTGLTVGQCYTWCFSGSCTGPGPGFNSICPYWQNVTPLPIELLSFECTSGTYIELQWVTASESNNKEFEVLKSIDAQFWLTLATVKAQNKPFKYVLRDFDDIIGIRYYKLVQVDLNDSKKVYNAILCSNYNEVIIEEYYDLLGNRLIHKPLNQIFIIKEIRNNSIKYLKSISYE